MDNHRYERVPARGGGGGGVAAAVVSYLMTQCILSFSIGAFDLERHSRSIVRPGLSGICVN